jgi:hypothetical protein
MKKEAFSGDLVLEEAMGLSRDRTSADDDKLHLFSLSQHTFN